MSPFGPPFVPAEPFPDIRIWSPVATPDGTLNVIVFSPLILPVPRHVEHVLTNSSPVPRQFGQIVWTLVTPNNVLCWEIIRPLPLHFEHVWGFNPPLPLQSWHIVFKLILKDFSQPNMASSNVKLILTSESSPLVADAFLDFDDLPPKKELMISSKSSWPKPNPEKSPNPPWNPPKSPNPPVPPWPALFTASAPYWSYIFLLFSSDKTL